jgi:hypothetical protein
MAPVNDSDISIDLLCIRVSRSPSIDLAGRFGDGIILEPGLAVVTFAIEIPGARVGSNAERGEEGWQEGELHVCSVLVLVEDGVVDGVVWRQWGVVELRRIPVGISLIRDATTDLLLTRSTVVVRPVIETVISNMHWSD